MPELNGPDAAIFAEGVTRDDIHALDQLAAAAWPAPHQTALGAWTLRYGNGVSRRANSVAPWPGAEGTVSLIDDIEASESFYKERGLPPRFQMSPAAEPEALDEELQNRGYEIEAPVTIQIAPADAFAADIPEVEVADDGSEAWWSLYIEGFERDARDIAKNARETAGFALIEDENGAPAAIGLGVLGGGWLGVFGMFTRPALRGRGLGAKIMAGLGRWAVDRGAIGIYLQVEKHNGGARRLYKRVGFRDAYGYYYRTLWP